MPGVVIPPGIYRFALVIEYCGGRYRGWQCQQESHYPTVQAALESALSFVAAEPISVVCAGRTDAGVHATNQIVHFDTEAHRPPKAWMLGGNSRLPDDIRIKWAQPVSFDFHARFSARRRTYRYLIANTLEPPAIAAGQCLWVRKPLDVFAMQQAANFCLGEQDFNAVRSSICQAKSPVRTLYSFTINRCNDWLVFELCGNGFLHHMVRNLMGLLLPVGLHEKKAEWVRDVLATHDRNQAGKTEAARGLYLVSVGYDKDYGFPAMSKGPFMLPDILTSGSLCDRVMATGND